MPVCLTPISLSSRYAGLLAPLDAPHHVRANEATRWREGVGVKKPLGSGAGSQFSGKSKTQSEGSGTGTGPTSWVDVGLRRPVLVEGEVAEGMRVTVRMYNEDGSGGGEVSQGQAKAQGQSVPFHDAWLGKGGQQHVGKGKGKGKGKGGVPSPSSSSSKSDRAVRGIAVSSSEPREIGNMYWGYKTRLAAGLSDVLTGGPKVGASVRAMRGAAFDTCI